MKTLKQAKYNAERKNLTDALTQTQGNIRNAAKIMDVTERHVHGLIKKHKLNTKNIKAQANHTKDDNEPQY